MLLGIGETGAAPRSTWDGVYTDQQALEGEALYQQRCSGCHGPNLEGGEDAPPLAGAQFGAAWNDRTLGELFSRMKRSMPMDAPGSLTAPQYSQIIAHVLHRNGFPSGASALPDRLDVLREIRFASSPSAQ
jgi:S-disulfanyl-L-cysteine oxidoreductase SoxD